MTKLQCGDRGIKDQGAMYKVGWFDRADGRQARKPRASRIRQVSPVVWGLGVTSLFTDLSAEMVNSVLPVYLFLHLHLNPLQYGMIDGVYNGLSIALIGLMAGVVTDRWRRHKQVAGAGYVLSAACKLLLVFAGGAWGWIMAIVGVDRLGKGIRTAPRDAMISLHTPGSLFGTAYAVHRFLDSTGALLGPIAGFALLALVAENFEVLWLVSSLVALLGVAALWLFVPAGVPIPRRPCESGAPATHTPHAMLSRRFLKLAVCGTVLALFTLSDGFLYLLLQGKSGTAAGYVPLFYVVTAAGYMLFALPLGLLADGYGRRRVFLAGYLVTISIYGVLLGSSIVSPVLQITCLLLLGLYYAATEGVLMAMASAVLPARSRATGLAVLLSLIGAGKLGSSVAFGSIWHQYGDRIAILVFAAGSIAALCLSSIVLYRQHD